MAGTYSRRTWEKQSATIRIQKSGKTHGYHWTTVLSLWVQFMNLLSIWESQIFSLMTYNGTRRELSNTYQISAQIQCIKPSKVGAEDIYVWLPFQTRIYSTKSGYNSHAQQTVPSNLHLLANPSSQNDMEFNWLIDVWSAKTNPKLKVFLWSIIQGALPIGAELQRRGMISAAHCLRYNEVEKSMHTFFLCPFAKEVWNYIPLKSPVHIAEDTDFRLALLRFWQAICLPPPTGIRSPILPWVCWFLWTARNKLIFEDKSSRPAEIATRGLSAALEWDQAQDVEKEQKSNHLPLKAAPTQTDWSKRAGVAWILNKDLPLRVQSGAQIVESVTSPLMAESLALRNRIEIMLQSGIHTTAIFSDCLALIRAIISKSQIKEIYGVLQDIDRLSFNLPLSISGSSLVPRTEKPML